MELMENGDIAVMHLSICLPTCTKMTHNCPLTSISLNLHVLLFPRILVGVYSMQYARPAAFALGCFPQYGCISMF